MRMSRTLQAHQLLDELCFRNIGADAVKTLQLGVEVIARGEHDGMRTVAVLDEEIAVGKKHLHRHEIVHEPIGCIRLKFTECTKNLDSYHGDGTFEQPLES